MSAMVPNNPGTTRHNARLLLAGLPGGELRLAAEMARQSGAQVFQADNVDAALGLARAGGGDLAMMDVNLDIARFITGLRAERIAIPVIACGIDAPAEVAVAAIRAGARDYVPLPPDRDLIAAAIMSVTLKTVEMLGAAPAFARVVEYARSMARAQAPLLVRGETGTGKELVARNIHQASGREGPFVTVECEGVAADVLESELFGHKAGAFPGAIAGRTGKLAEAAGGTVYLREIGALPAALQARLADLLAKGLIMPLGDGAPVRLSARIIAGSRQDLRTLVSQGLFRADLMHRLGLVEVNLPPLKERGDDIALLAQHFARERSEDNGLPLRQLDDQALALLRRYEWPGNIRELEAVVHRGVLLANSQLITPAALVLADGVQMGVACAERRAADERIAAGGSDGEPVDSLIGRTVEDVERELILKTLGHCGGNRTTASSILGISVRTMRNKLREFSQAGYSI